MAARQAMFPRQTITPDSGLSTGEEMLQLLSNPFQASLQTNAFWASLGISLGVSAGLALLFCFVRPRNTLVYAPKLKNADKDHAPPPLGKGVFSWIKPVHTANEPYLVERIGMDAVIFLRFTRMLRNIFVVLAFIGLVLMIPVNVGLGKKTVSHGSSVFSVMTPLYIFGGGLWAQVVLAWLIDLVVIYFLWHNYRRVHKLRRAYLESPEYQQSLHARTLLIRDIPPQFRNNEGLARITDEVNPTGAAPRTTIGRNVKILPELIQEHEETVRELESVLAKYMKHPDRLPPHRPKMKAPRKYKGPTMNGKVDAIDYLTDHIRGLETQINHIREHIDTRDPMPYGFASWDQVSDAHTVAYLARRKRPQGTKFQLVPRPNDLIWTNLKLSPGSRKSKRFMNGVWITVLTIIWTPFNAGIAVFLSNLSNLGLVWKGFRAQLEAHHTGWAIVQGIAAPAITSLVYLILPIIFRRLQIRAGDVTKTDRERHVLRNLYSFFTFNNLIIFSIFSAVWQYVTIVIEYNKQGNDTWTSLREGRFFLVITTSLCQISPFWVTWILQRNLGAAADLAQLWHLTTVWFARTFMAPTPRQNIEWTAPPAFDYASYYNYFLFYATVALCYSTLQPIVLVVTALYFTIDAVCKKYLLMYVFVTKTESGGQFWVTIFNRIVFATILSNVIIGVVVKARGGWDLVGALVPLLFVMIGFKWYCMKTFDLDLKYFARGGMHDQERLPADGKSRKVERVSTKYGHPALYKPLMTPMVHEKAKHVLAEIYQGRLNSEGGQSLAFSDIAMQPMSHQTGKVMQDVPFEIVPEAQQDYQFYKNHSDFRDQGGDTPSRAQTPVSFAGKEGYISPKGFRTQTPVPMTGREDYNSAESSRAGSPTTGPVQQHHGIHRKPVDPSHIPTHLRTASLATSGDGDLGVQHDLNDDRTNLLQDIGDFRAPNGEFMSLDRWRTHESGDGSDAGAYRELGGGYTPSEEEFLGYDYFRGKR
ncbi:hypothetical protein A1O3_06802 [Capronia epimyces CBS 606.96]|uniref:CSC1/OSCA1-like 7TM region domain-containing protein n=1 Tax=Capronia epimyces CBS 606.96 TaxID=1182542 RepID=W9Y033_9EURO|nr:uncharacterized protein A1O3_06802 [Capronia epimyces CBS 606.96]EXJ82985.1 hypothetical protein A1O3_06802 [Capronia epimyces CBS 606.96]